jgi:hypothetical protein
MWESPLRVISRTGWDSSWNPEQAKGWIDEDQRNAEVLFPFLNGEDLNSRPDISPSRWIIDFADRTENEAAAFTAPFGWVKKYVKPERLRNNRKVYRYYWWLLGEKRPGLRRAISRLHQVIVLAKVSRTIIPMRETVEVAFSEKVQVFATDSFADQAVLSSGVHQLWAVKHGTTMRTDPTYIISDVFETFPRPYRSDGLFEIGKMLDTERREIMLRRELGLTKLYNLINDPDIADESDADVARMRQIHVDLDHAVMAAYGWEDLPLDHGFHTYRQMSRWTVSPTARVEILDRLLEENHRRAALEVHHSTADIDPPD